jgi:type II secretory pathway predicted ATPase ExeA
MPFGTQPSPRFAYPSAEHQIAVAKMRYAADQKRGLALLMGPVGSGKTTIAHQLQRTWAADDGKTVAFLPSAAVRSPGQFLRLVSEAYGLVPVRIAADNQKIIERFLLEEYAAGRHPVLLIDEAQTIHPDNIDVLAALSNFQTAEDKLITIVLLAQDNFPNKLSRKDAFRSRIAVVSNLDPLAFEDMKGMIEHRIRTAGGAGADALFEARSLIDIYNITRGVPRDVCVLCDASLVNAYVRAETVISPAVVAATYSEMVAAKKWPVKAEGAQK